MINLFYHSHTVVPAHLEELERLGIMEGDEQVLMALDGVLQDGSGRRVSGPTLHDYCLLTSLRIMLWARDYGQHRCYAFPLTELSLVEGSGIDPLHAQLQLTFEAEGQEPQRFTLLLLPTNDLQPAVTLLHLAAEAAQHLRANGISQRDAGPEIVAILSGYLYGHVEGGATGTPYRWPDDGEPMSPPDPIFMTDPSNLPPEQLYTASRVARSAWDTLRRTLRETELPIDLNGNNLRDLADTVRALNELITTVATNPSARDMAMAFLSSRRRGAGDDQAQPMPPPREAAPRTSQPASPASPASPAAQSTAEYHEIPLRRSGKGQPEPVRRSSPAARPPEPPAESPRTAQTERHEIPLRRRQTTPTPPAPAPRPQVAVSGSGDADSGESSK